MGKTLSIDHRTRLVAAISGGMSHRRAAERFGVSAVSAVRWAAAVNTTGSVEAKPQDGDTRSHRGVQRLILAAATTQKDISLVELADLSRIEHGASFGASTVWRCLDRHGMTFKKTAHAAEQERPDVAARRRAWFAAQPGVHRRDRRFHQDGPAARPRTEVEAAPFPWSVDGFGLGRFCVGDLHGSLVGHRRTVTQRRVHARRVGPALDEAEAGYLRLGLKSKPACLQQLAFEGGKEHFAHGIVVSVADRAHGRAHSGLTAAITERQGRDWLSWSL